jgi:hypothetical protein
VLVMAAIQLASLILSVLIQLLMLVAIHRGYMTWKYSILPGLLLMAITVFYVNILFFGGFGDSAANALGSAVLRLVYIVVSGVNVGVVDLYHRRG